MNAQKLFNELVEKGYNAELVQEFTYIIDKDRKYNTVHTENVPNEELINIATSNGCLWAACISVNVREDKPQERIVYEAIPNDMKSFDFVK